jgi:hypothetical protein
MLQQQQQQLLLPPATQLSCLAGLLVLLPQQQRQQLVTNTGMIVLQQTQQPPRPGQSCMLPSSRRLCAMHMKLSCTPCLTRHPCVHKRCESCVPLRHQLGRVAGQRLHAATLLLQLLAAFWRLVSLEVLQQVVQHVNWSCLVSWQTWRPRTGQPTCVLASMHQAFYHVWRCCHR